MAISWWRILQLTHSTLGLWVYLLKEGISRTVTLKCGICRELSLWRMGIAKNVSNFFFVFALQSWSDLLTALLIQGWVSNCSSGSTGKWVKSRVGQLSNSSLSLFKKERLWANRSQRSLKKSSMRDLLANRFKNWAFHTQKFLFFICFWQLSPYFMPKSKLLLLLFAQLLFFKEWRE